MSKTRETFFLADSKGVAILMVIAVLAALMAISAPFVFSMLQHGKQARNDTSQQMAREGAEGALNHALGHLMQTTTTDFVANETEVTTLKDLIVDMDFNARTGSDLIKRHNLEFNVQNPRGLLWSSKIEDEQGKVNLNTAPPGLIGSLFASAVLSEAVSTGATALSVDSTEGFNKNGGFVCLNGEPEPLKYSSASGSLIQLEAGLLYGHQRGALVYDGRGRLISNMVYGKGAKYVPYSSIYQIKAIQNLNPDASIPPEDFARVERHITYENGIGTPLWGRGERVGAISEGAVVGGVNIENGQAFNVGTLLRLVRSGIPEAFQRVLTSKMNEQTGSATVQFEEDVSVGTTTDTQDMNIVRAEPALKHPINLNTATDEVLVAVFTGVGLRGYTDVVDRRIAQEVVKWLRGRGIRGNRDERPVYRTHDDFRKALWKACENNVITLQQRDALIINATEPNSSKLRYSTVTFCYFSYGSMTLEGSGVANSDTGAQLARHTVRQMISLPTLFPGRFLVQYQQQFQELIDQGMGARVVTFPRPLGTHRFRKGAPLTKYGMVDSGNIRLAVGESGSMQGRTSMTHEWIEHCNDENDPGFVQEGYNMSARQPFTIPDSGQPVSNLSPPTSVELWFRPKGSGQCTFFDQGMSDDRNRVSFSYDPGSSGLVVQIWDACMSSGKGGNGTRKPVKYIYPVTFNTGDWYHVAASWKTSHPGGQEIRVDAQPYPADGPTALEFQPGGRLGGTLSNKPDDNQTLTLQDGDGEDFPKAGALKIGEEIIEYTGHNGNSFSGLYRGARMSAVAKHEGGEWVMPFGFANKTEDDLPVGKATLVEDLAVESLTNTRVQFPPNTPKGKDFVLDSATDKIPVADASNMPSSGFILCQGELIYYGAKKRAQFGWELNKLQRAQTSTHANQTAPARNLHNGQGVALASVEISNSNEYNAKGIIQIDDATNDKKVEWIHYGEKKIVNGKHYMVGEMWNPPPGGTITTGAADTPSKGLQPYIGFWDRFRYKFGIGDSLYLTGSKTGRKSNHDKKAKVIPVIRVHAAHCGGWNADITPATPAGHDSPYGENGISEVTVAEKGSSDGELRYVKQAFMDQYANWSGDCQNGGKHFNSWGFNFYVGLDDFVSRRYPVGNTRYLHWPSGELPDIRNQQRHVCSDKNSEGKVNGEVDELRVNTYSSEGGRIVMTTEGTGIDAGAESILIERYDEWASPYRGSGNTGGNNNFQPTQPANDQPVPLNWPKNGCLARIEDELIYVADSSSQQIQYYADVYPPLKDAPPMLNKADRRWYNDCTQTYELHPNIKVNTVQRLNNVKRGVLGTKAVEHPVGAQIMLLDGMAVSHLIGSLDALGDKFTVRDAAGFPPEGYVWINDEVISYQKRNGNSFTGCRYFRGRFGTSPSDHEQGDIVRCLPFRYWDRNPLPDYDGDGLAFVQAGMYATGARWVGLDLELVPTETQSGIPARVLPHVLVRFDGKPGWEVNSSNKEGSIFEFHKTFGKGRIRLNGLDGSAGVRADQIETRIYWEYFNGAFMKGKVMQLDWKRSFAIERLRGTYTTPLILGRLDEVEKR